MLRALAVLVALPALAPAQELPPAYPRPGATSLLENEHVIVWDIAWLKQEYPFHRHRYDHVGVYYAPGDRVITSTDGARRPVSTPAWNISFQPSGVTHAEAGASDEPLRAVFVQIKRPPRGRPPASVPGAAFPFGTPEQRFDNERATVWEYRAQTPGSMHTHAHDAVVVWFGPDGGPSVHWVSRGAAHETDLAPEATRTFVFEIK